MLDAGPGCVAHWSVESGTPSPSVSVPPLPPLGVKVRVAGAVSMVPAASVAHTSNVYVVPAVRPP